jgi:hypothetical protein
MQVVVRAVIVLGLAACGNHEVVPPSDGAMGGTDGAGAVGLTIPWSVKPTVPGSVTSNVVVTSMLFRVDSLRVVGDAGTSVSLGDLTLTWATGETPMPAVFVDAPSGLYSKVVFHADGEIVDYSWEIDGTVQLDDGSHPFAIHDREDLTADINASATLEPGGNATLPVELDIDQPFDGLDFKSLDSDDGTLTLDTLDSQMDDFRDKLKSAIVPGQGLD